MIGIDDHNGSCFIVCVGFRIQLEEEIAPNPAATYSFVIDKFIYLVNTYESEV